MLSYFRFKPTDLFKVFGLQFSTRCPFVCLHSQPLKRAKPHVDLPIQVSLLPALSSSCKCFTVYPMLQLAGISMLTGLKAQMPDTSYGCSQEFSTTPPAITLGLAQNQTGRLFSSYCTLSSDPKCFHSNCLLFLVSASTTSLKRVLPLAVAVVIAVAPLVHIQTQTVSYSTEKIHSLRVLCGAQCNATPVSRCYHSATNK